MAPRAPMKPSTPAPQVAQLRPDAGQLLEQQRVNATYSWDASPISTARFSMEVWNAIRNEDWTLASDSFWVSHWPQRLWDMTKHSQYIGGAGGEEGHAVQGEAGRHHPGGADEAARGFQAHDVVKGGRHASGSRSVGAERKAHQIECDHNRRTRA